MMKNESEFKTATLKNLLRNWFHYIFKELREDDISVNEIEEIFAWKYAVWYHYFSIIFGTHIYCLLTHQSDR